MAFVDVCKNMRQQINVSFIGDLFNDCLSTPRPDICKGKGKAVSLRAWSVPEDSRKLRFPDSMTMAQDGGKVVSLTHRPPLPPGNPSICSVTE